jgi:hypothetical protein
MTSRSEWSPITWPCVTDWNAQPGRWAPPTARCFAGSCPATVPCSGVTTAAEAWPRLSGRVGISNWKARRWVGAAYALEHLPRLSASPESGALSLDKVVELTRFATPATEKDLIG